MINKNLKIEGFSYPVTVIRELQKLIDVKYNDLFYAVLAHGSVATNEVINYSDFDGLIIVKDRYLGSKQLESFKKASMKVIYKFDPLQHHGWFQIAESDLKKYPENYLPVTTLEHAKLIYPNVKSLELLLKLDQTADYQSGLLRMLNQFEKRNTENWRPKNMFQLKSVLSQVMLIPCLYYSAAYNDGIFKRDSFEAVRHNFTDLEWKPIACATSIRANWDYSLNPFQKLLMGLTGRLKRKIVTRFFAPRIPIAVQEKLNDEFFNNLIVLSKKIKTDIE